jgi:hypothetical protein
MLGENMNIVKKNTDGLPKTSKKAGLSINAEET